MTHFPDFSPYRYAGLEANTYTVGWLSKDFLFPTGSIPRKAIERLEKLVSKPVKDNCLGFHTCELCNQVYGKGEVRVASLDGTFFAAPTLITHYISEHQYMPPEEFIRAVLTTPISQGELVQVEPRQPREPQDVHPWYALTPRFLVLGLKAEEVMSDERWSETKADTPFGQLQEDSRYYDTASEAMVQLLLDPKYRLWQRLRELQNTDIELLG